MLSAICRDRSLFGLVRTSKTNQIYFMSLKTDFKSFVQSSILFMVKDARHL